MLEEDGMGIGTFLGLLLRKRRQRILEEDALRSAEEETTRVFKPNDSDFQNTIPKPNANRKTWISRARQAVISLSNSILSFVFVHRFFYPQHQLHSRRPAFSHRFPQDQYQLPNPTWTFRIEKVSDTNAGHSFLGKQQQIFCKRSTIFFQEQAHKSQRKLRKSSFSVRVNVWRVFFVS